MADDDGACVGGLGELLDQRKVRFGTFAANLDLDPIAGAADMEVEQAVIG